MSTFPLVEISSATVISGSFSLIKNGVELPLNPNLAAYLNEFCHSKRVKRFYSPAIKDDPVRLKARIPLGKDNGFYVGNDVSSVVPNMPPLGQPSTKCPWSIEGSKVFFRDRPQEFLSLTTAQWLDFLMFYFLTPNGYKIEGLTRYEIVHLDSDLMRTDVVGYISTTTQAQCVVLRDYRQGMQGENLPLFVRCERLDYAILFKGEA